MSQYFQLGDQVLWNPATRVAQLYVGLSDAMSALIDQPTGIGPVIADEYAIDLPVFESFVGALVLHYQRATHSIMKSMMDGFIATSMVMLERACGTIPALDDERLIELRNSHRTMPV
jgi:hypothetical protein